MRLCDHGCCIAFRKPGIRDTSDRLLRFSHLSRAQTLRQRKVVAIVNDLDIRVERPVVAEARAASTSENGIDLIVCQPEFRHASAMLWRAKI